MRTTQKFDWRLQCAIAAVFDFFGFFEAAVFNTSKNSFKNYLSGPLFAAYIHTIGGGGGFFGEEIRHSPASKSWMLGARAK